MCMNKKGAYGKRQTCATIVQIGIDRVSASLHPTRAHKAIKLKGLNPHQKLFHHVRQQPKRALKQMVRSIMQCPHHFHVWLWQAQTSYSIGCESSYGKRANTERTHSYIRGRVPCSYLCGNHHAHVKMQNQIFLHSTNLLLLWAMAA